MVLQVSLSYIATDFVPDGFLPKTLVIKCKDTPMGARMVYIFIQASRFFFLGPQGIILVKVPLIFLNMIGQIYFYAIFNPFVIFQLISMILCL